MIKQSELEGNVMFIDIVTATQEKNLKDAKKDIQEAFMLWTKLSNLSDFEAQDIYQEKGCFHPSYNKIVGFSVALLIEDSIKCFYLIEREDGAAFTQLIKILNKNKEKGIIFQNASYSIPQIRADILKRGLSIDSLPSRYDDRRKKPWDVEEIRGKINTFSLLSNVKGIGNYNLTLADALIQSGLRVPESLFSNKSDNTLFHEEELNLLEERSSARCLSLLNIAFKQSGILNERKVQVIPFSKNGKKRKEEKSSSGNSKSSDNIIAEDSVSDSEISFEKYYPNILDKIKETKDFTKEDAKKIKAALGETDKLSEEYMDHISAIITSAILPAQARKGEQHETLDRVIEMLKN